MKPFTKLKKRAQWAGGGCGYNQHVDKYMKRQGNRFIRRWLRRDMERDGT